jgi:hypothetical protein
VRPQPFMIGRPRSPPAPNSHNVAEIVKATPTSHASKMHVSDEHALRAPSGNPNDQNGAGGSLVVPQARLNKLLSKLI